MKLLMISGDRSILRGKKGAFWYTLEEFHKEWDRIDIICPRVIQEMHPMEGTSRFGNVFFHPLSPRDPFPKELDTGEGDGAPG